MTMRKLLVFSGLIVLIDQATKVAVKGSALLGIPGMRIGESRDIFGDVVRATYIENPGMAFGWNFDMPVVLSIFSIAASFFLVRLLKRTESSGNNGLRMAFALILGGAVGNLIDRAFYGLFYDYATLFHGRVVDFIDIDIPDISLFGREMTHFYIFNIADAAVSVGVVLLLIFYPKKAKHPLTGTPSAPSDPAAAMMPHGAPPESSTSHPAPAAPPAIEQPVAVGHPAATSSGDDRTLDGRHDG